MPKIRIPVTLMQILNLIEEYDLEEIPDGFGFGPIGTEIPSIQAHYITEWDSQRHNYNRYLEFDDPQQVTLFLLRYA